MMKCLNSRQLNKCIQLCCLKTHDFLINPYFSIFLVSSPNRMRKPRLTTNRGRPPRASSGSSARHDQRQTSPCITPPFSDLTAKYPRENNPTDGYPRGNTPTEDFSSLKIAPCSNGVGPSEISSTKEDKLLTTLELLSLPALQRTASRTTVSLENVEMWESDSEETESVGRFDNIDGMFINPRKTFDFSDLKKMRRPVAERLLMPDVITVEKPDTTTDNQKPHIPIIRSQRQTDVSVAWPPHEQNVITHVTSSPSRRKKSTDNKQTEKSERKKTRHERTRSETEQKTFSHRRSSSLTRPMQTNGGERVSPERSPTRSKQKVSTQIQASSHTVFKQTPRKPPRRQLPQQPTSTMSTEQPRAQIKYTTQHSSGSDSSNSSHNSLLNRTYVLPKSKQLYREQRAVDSLETLPKRTKSSDSETTSNSNTDSNGSPAISGVPFHGTHGRNGLLDGLNRPVIGIPDAYNRPPIGLADAPKILEKKQVKFHGIVQMKEGDTNSYDFLRMSGDTAKLYKKKYLPSVYADDER